MDITTARLVCSVGFTCMVLARLAGRLTVIDRLVLCCGLLIFVGNVFCETVCVFVGLCLCLMFV